MVIDTIELPFKFSDLCTVSIHLLAGAGPVLVELVDDQGGIAAYHEALDAELNGYAEAMETCLIFDCIIGGQKMNSEYISELVLGGSNEQYTCPGTFNVESAIEVDLPMLRAVGRDRLLDLSPFGDEVSQNL